LELVRAQQLVLAARVDGGASRNAKNQITSHGQDCSTSLKKLSLNRRVQDLYALSRFRRSSAV